MIFSYNWLQSFFQAKLPEPKKLAEILTMHFAEVEEIKKDGQDFTLDIDVRPNRAGDCFSHLGIAREIATITGLKYIGDTYVNLELREDKDLKAKDFIQVEVKLQQACPRYTARVITNVKIEPSPRWLQGRLKVCGLRPINNIVDIANYVMLETGQPLHAFDGEKIESQKIIVRFAKNREKIVTLDEQKFDLNPDVLVIADEKKPVAIAGIKGGKLPEIDKKTKVVVLESANFNSQTIRQGSKKLNLKTDASLRFEHGIDPNLTELAINRAAYLIQRIAKGKIAKGLVDFYPKKVLPKIIKLDLDYVEKLLGIKISVNEIKDTLKKLNFKLTETRSLRKTNQIEVEIPSFRLDVNIPEDLIEEVGRIYGYQKIKSVFPISFLVPSKRNLDIFWEDMTKDILKEAGFTEVYNYSFISENDAKIFKSFQNLIELENSMSEEQKYLRSSLIPNLLKNIQKNQDYFSEIKIFELGKVFEKPAKEERILTGVITGDAFFQAKGVLDILLNKLGISNIFYDEYRTAAEEREICWWYPRKCAEIKVDGERIGFLGEISQRILNEFKLKQKVIYFDIFFEKLSKLASEEHEYRPVSKFPSAVRDIAILVPYQVRVEEVLNKIETVGGSLVRDIDLFDIYEGEELPGGKKNLAFHIIYQAEDRTLSSKEIDELQNKIIKNLEEKPEWQVRK
ncbi:MAG: phenylalanine--tRNA ligase subunit beta [Candidatus Nealsonbacteria bacterium CG23_combo_of_CG06-09_8_20_14_all_37_18]|uniref:Phenylalanine--tRNA ligase beta subunit n=1 Tax=Candidatus Nealsonbacteria bacterium CG23_combo_of_CG06-09_8_20_14_all_37_18 TaxID=1974720 RepID=A0A2G9YYQ6_9BACT|nr:MAG: phenylalanine--tRNA ligase subunit beta [Candidatus Nealsonbacteria bacterium CG23_combo_of_CG06-09_8_20_14_all_37_18]